MRGRRVKTYAFAGAALFGIGACAVPGRSAGIPAPGVGPYSNARGAARSKNEAARVRREPPQADNEWPSPVEDNQLFGFFLFDQLEYRVNDGASNSVRWDAQGWYGGDNDKVWFRSEGESTTSGASATDAELQLLYSRMVAPFWDVQVGARYDTLSGSGPDRSRWLGVVGFQGFAPYRFDVEPALFVSEEGDVSARLTGTTDWLLTQRLILQPRLETEVAAQDVEEFGIGEGLEYLELGLRLRYEVRREIAPYVGIEWEKLLGQTADFARAEGDDDSSLALVFGLRVWL